MSTPTLPTAPLGDLQTLMAANREAINAAVAKTQRTPSRAVIYARISDDPYATEEGTDEQVSDTARAGVVARIAVIWWPPLAVFG